jgi:hypothetical protein
VIYVPNNESYGGWSSICRRASATRLEHRDIEQPIAFARNLRTKHYPFDELNIRACRKRTFDDLVNAYRAVAHATRRAASTLVSTSPSPLPSRNRREQ